MDKEIGEEEDGNICRVNHLAETIWKKKKFLQEQSGIKGTIWTTENKQVVNTPAICYVHWEGYKYHNLPQMLFSGIKSHLFVGAPRARLWSTP